MTKRLSELIAQLQVRQIILSTMPLLVCVVFTLPNSSCKTCECPAYSLNVNAKPETQANVIKGKNKAITNIILSNKHINTPIAQTGYFNYQNYSYGYPKEVFRTSNPL